MTTVVSQIDPARVEDALVAQEAEKWPEWETRPGAVPQSYWNRLEEEWSCADAVLVNSEWSKAALVEQGVASEKLFTVPLAFEPQVFCEPSLGRARGPLRVLFLGQVNLRKGFPYLVEAARLLKSTAIVIDVVGPTSIASPILRGLPDNIRFHGPVDRRAASGWYNQADVFVLPTISDGFALTQLEAMAHGVPVITTERCGDVVDHGVDGWRLAAADASAIADLLDSPATHPETLVDMSHSAQMKSQQFTLARYLRGLDTIWGRINRSCSPIVTRMKLTPDKVQFVTVNDDDEGQRIDNYLMRIIHGVPRPLVYRVLRKGEVRVNKGRVKQSYRLVSGDVVRVPPIKFEPVDDKPLPPRSVIDELEQSIIYEGDGWLAINKPSGIAVHGGSGCALASSKRCGYCGPSFGI